MASSFACSDAALYKLYTSGISLWSIVAQKLDLILSYQGCYRFWSFPAARVFSCIYAYDASIICNDIIDGFLFRITLSLLGASLAGFMKKRKADVFSCLFSITE